MKERTIQLGGETLNKGSTVVVFTSHGREEHEVVKIGTSRIYLMRHNREEPFDIATRQHVGSTVGRIPHFRTRTEVVAADRRRDLMIRLRKLGIQSVDGALRDLKQYPDEALEEVIAVLSRHRNTGAAEEG
ncbi:hypothetical protein ACFW2V_12560 [Streptomyces sp. NPDC058947]|uniref:beta barrel domain-containing protein n=1 Tax=Streptomyces sp. NPDC058947 TaxID=3346675 RepID=UPI003673E780